MKRLGTYEETSAQPVGMGGFEKRRWEVRDSSTTLIETYQQEFESRDVATVCQKAN